MKRKQFEHIFRTYEDKRRDINASAKLIHSYLFEKNKSISNYDESDALLLTDFFKTMKQAYLENNNNIGSLIKTTLLESEVNNLPILNFGLGGRGAGGKAFEHEIEKLFESKVIDSIEGKTLGEQMAGVVIDLHTDDIQEAQKKVEEFIGEEWASSLSKTMQAEIVQKGDLFGVKGEPTDLILKIGYLRAGKIDVQKGNEQNLFEFSVQGEKSQRLQTAIDIINKAAFSIKSYKTGGHVHLGKTQKTKSVFGVAEFVSSQNGYEDAHWAGLYYLHHPNPKRKRYESQKAISELYEHYAHMRKVFELTGIGLSYSDLQDLKGVDFLLVNRYDSNEIKVYSTQGLLASLAANKYKTFGID